MRQKLLVFWIEHPSLKEVERDLIALMQPPLNGTITSTTGPMGGCATLCQPGGQRWAAPDA